MKPSRREALIERSSVRRRQDQPPKARTKPLQLPSSLFTDQPDKLQRSPFMRYMHTKGAIRLVVLLTVAGVALASIPAARAGNDNRTPDLPSPECDSIQVPSGHKVAFHVYALGVQIYRWSGTS